MAGNREDRLNLSISVDQAQTQRYQALQYQASSVPSTNPFQEQPGPSHQLYRIPAQNAQQTQGLSPFATNSAFSLTPTRDQPNYRAALPAAPASSRTPLNPRATDMFVERLVATLTPLFDGHNQAITKKTEHLDASMEKLMSHIKEAKEEAQNQTKEVVVAMQKSFNMHQAGSKALQSRVEKLEEHIRKSLDRDSQDSLSGQLNAISFTIGELLERMRDPEAPTVPLPPPNYTDISTDTEDLLNVTTRALVQRGVSPISNRFVDALVGSSSLRQLTPEPVIFHEVATSPFGGLCIDVGVDARISEPERLSLHDTATSPIRMRYTSIGTGTRTPPTSEQWLQPSSVGVSTMPGLHRSYASHYSDIATLVDVTGLDVRSTGDLGDQSISPRLKRKHDKPVHPLEDGSINTTNIEDVEAGYDAVPDGQTPERRSLTNVKPRSGSSPVDSNILSVVDLLGAGDNDNSLDEAIFSPQYASPQATLEKCSSESREHSFQGMVNTAEQEISDHARIESLPSLLPSIVASLTVPISETLPLVPCLPVSDDSGVSREPVGTPELVHSQMTSSSELSVTHSATNKDLSQEVTPEPGPQFGPDLHSTPQVAPLFLPDPFLSTGLDADDIMSVLTPLSNLCSPLPLEKPTLADKHVISLSSNSASLGVHQATSTPVVLENSKDLNHSPTVKKPSFPKVKQPKIALPTTTPRKSFQQIVVHPPPIYISDSSSSLSDYSDSISDSDADTVAVLKTKKSLSITRSLTLASRGVVLSAPAPRINLQKKLLTLKTGQSAATTRVKKRKASSLEEKEPPLKRARLRVSTAIGEDSVTPDKVSSSTNSKGKGKETAQDGTGGPTASKEERKSLAKGNVGSKLRSRHTPMNCQWPKLNQSKDQMFNQQFVECDVCYLWYHYGCVGIVDSQDPRIKADELLVCPPCKAGHSSKCSNCETASLTHENCLSIEHLTAGKAVVCARPDCEVQEQASNEFFMSAIIGRCTNRTGPGYIWLVKWDGYPIAECTWEREEGMSDPHSFIQHFKQAAKKEGHKPDKDPRATILLREAISGGWTDPNA